MEDWSREPHIGKWAAATFFYTLAARDDGSDLPLATLLAAKAKETATRLKPGEPFHISDAGVSSFLTIAGERSLMRRDLDSARVEI